VTGMGAQKRHETIGGSSKKLVVSVGWHSLTYKEVMLLERMGHKVREKRRGTWEEYKGDNFIGETWEGK